MINISLRPYVGEIHLHASLKSLHKEYRELTGEKYPYSDDPNGGCFVLCENKAGRVYLVWAATPHALAHEMAHVCLITFDLIGADPRESNGEPFCYLLSQLLIEAKK